MVQEKFLKPEFVIGAKIRMLRPSNIKKFLIRIIKFYITRDARICSLS